jgi:hypothetical protein
MVDFPNWVQTSWQIPGQNIPTNVDDVPGGDVPPSGSLGGSDETPPLTTSYGNGQNGGTPDLEPGNPPPGGYGSLSLQDFKLDTYSLQGLAKVLFDSSLEQRKAAREDRAAQRDANIAAQQQVADEIRSQAAFAFAASMVSAGISIVGAAVNIGSQVKSMRTEVQAQKLNTDAQKLDGLAGKSSLAQETKMQNARFTEDSVARTKLQNEARWEAGEGTRLRTDAAQGRSAASELSNTAQALTQKGAAGQQIGTAIGQMGGATLNLFASEQEAEKAESQADSEKARTAADDQTDFIKAYEENMRKVLDVLQAVQQAEADTNRTIARG